MPAAWPSTVPMPSWACPGCATSSIEGLPIAGSIGSLKCGVAVVELATGRIVAMLEFVSGIDELFDVRVDPFSRSPFFSGPDAQDDGTPPIWLVPSPRFDLMSS